MTDAQAWKLFWLTILAIAVLGPTLGVWVYNEYLEATYPYCDDPGVEFLEKCIKR